MRRILISSARKRALRLGVAGAAVLMLAGVDANAQDEVTPPAEATRSSSEPLEEVVITGSRLRRAESDMISPVEVISSDEMKQSGFTSTQDILSNLTLNGQGTLSQSFSGAFAGGAAGVSLRGLTVGSTLVLIDGHRTSPYPIGDDGQRAFVDTSNLPFEAIERIDVLKDGASALYGSDAIAGVVNIILKETYEGASFSGSRGVSQQNDGHQYNASGIWGTGNLDDDGYNFYVTGEFRRQDAIGYDDRDGIFSLTDVSSNIGFFTDPDTGMPVAVPGENLTLGVPTAANGMRPLSSTGYVTYLGADADGDGDPDEEIRFNPGCDQASFDAGGCAYREHWNQIQPETRNVNGLAKFTKRLSDIWQLSFEGGYFQSEAEQVRSPATTFRAGFTGLSVGPGLTPTFRPTVPATTIGRSNPSFPTGVDPSIDRARLTYTFLDVGNRVNTTKAKSYRAVSNLTGGFGEWEFESAIGYTAVDLERVGFGLIDPAALQIALDDPINPYLVGQPNSAEVLAFVTPRLSQDNEARLYFVHAGVTRSLFELPGGPLGLAMGLDYFKRTQDARAPFQTEQGLVPGFSNSFAIGTQRVSSAYAELLAPVTDSLELDAAVRYDRYNISGGKASPKFGFRFQPIAEIALRGTYALGFRAPGPAENGDAGQSFVAGGSPDPILCPNPDVPTAPGNFQGQCNVRAPGLQSTNEDLNPEESTSYSLGLVVDPMDWLTASIDFYDITIDDQIVSGGDTTRVRSPSLEPLPQFQAGGGTVLVAPPVGPIAFDTISFVNANRTHTNGFDVRLETRTSFLGLGELTSEAVWSFTNRYDIEIGGKTYNLAGTHGPFFFTGNTGNPKSRVRWATTLSRGAWEVTGTLNFISSFDVTDPSSEAFAGISQDTCLQGLTASGAASTLFESQLAAGIIPQGVDCRVDRFTTFDMKAKYDVTENLTFNGSVLNLFDVEAPLDWQTYGSAGGGAVPFNPAFHSKGGIGRFFTVGFTYRFW